jgi:hypothetical protein
MNSLFSTTCEYIRKNWNEYSKIIQTNSTEYELLWQDLYKKHNLTYNNPNIVILKEFIESTNKNITFKEKSNAERKELHDFCNIIGLHHFSSGDGKKRKLKIHKPKQWLWEFTPQKIRTQQEPIIYVKKNLYCDICSKKKEENQLYVSPYIRNIICETCLDEDEELNCHKWECLHDL